MAKNPIKEISPPKKTTAAQYSKMSERFTPGWDKNCASEQKIARVAERTAMGQKKTPIQ